MLALIRTGVVRRLVVCITLALAGAMATPAAFADLPSSVASRVTKINAALDAVEKALDADRLTTAQRKLKDAQKILEEIERRYGGKFDASDPAYAATTERLAASTARVEAATGSAGAAEAEGQAANAAHEALCRSWVEKLRPFVTPNDDRELLIGAAFNRADPEAQARARAAYLDAKGLFAEYQAADFAMEKTMELKGVESRLAGALRYYDREAGKSAQEAVCAEWVKRLAPYVDVGMNSRRRLIAAATVDPQQIEAQQALFDEATLVFAEYRKAEFPLGKTHRLLTLEEAMEQSLEAFPEAMAESRAMMSGDIGTRLDRVLTFLERYTGWRSDTAKKPPVIAERDLAPLREAVEEFAGTAIAGDRTSSELRRSLEAIEATNVEHRQIRARRTFQQPDAYAGADLAALKKEAKQVAARAHPKATIVKVTVPTRDWVVEDVVEFTDTSRTALRRRITRSVRAEVSLKQADGTVWLRQVYLGQDRQPDGGWGPVKGHTTWLDPMAPENLGKLVPAAKT